MSHRNLNRRINRLGERIAEMEVRINELENRIGDGSGDNGDDVRRQPDIGHESDGTQDS